MAGIVLHPAFSRPPRGSGMYRRQQRAKALALPRMLRCNEASLNERTHPMTVKKRRLIPNFEARSAALFATLSLGTVMALHAQTPAQQPIPPNRNNWTTAQIAEAFKRLDANGDGLISREEAAPARGVAKHFDQADTNRDGMLSAPEFEAAMKQAS